MLLSKQKSNNRRWERGTSGKVGNIPGVYGGVSNATKESAVKTHRPEYVYSEVNHAAMFYSESLQSEETGSESPREVKAGAGGWGVR